MNTEQLEDAIADEGQVMYGELVLVAHHTCGHTPDVSVYTRDLAEHAQIAERLIDAEQTGYIVTCDRSDVSLVREFAHEVNEPVYAVYWETGWQYGSFNGAHDMVESLSGGPSVVECGDMIQANVELEDCVI